MPTIATNTAANTALVYLNRNSAQQSQSIAKISSGSRIVSAGDDAAGLAIGSQLRADVAVLQQAAVNVQNGQALLQVADGALSAVTDVLVRAKSLAAQSVSGAVDATSRGFLNTEYLQLIAEINAVETATTFNGTALIDGTFNTNFLVGADATDLIAVDLSGVNADATSLLGAVGNITTAALAATELAAIETGIAAVATDRATIGALSSRLGFRGDVIANAIDNTEDATSSILDVDIAAEQTRFTNFQVLTEAAIAGLSQANQLTSSLLALLR